MRPLFSSLLSFLSPLPATLTRRVSGGLSPGQRRWLRRLAPTLLLAALAGYPLAALALLPLALPLSLLGAALAPPPWGYPLSTGLARWAEASPGDTLLPLLLWFHYPGAGDELAGLSTLSPNRRALRLLGGLLRLAASTLAPGDSSLALSPGMLVHSLGELAGALASLLPLTLATLAPESPASGGLRFLAREALALLLRGYALQGEMVHNLLFVLLPWLLPALLALVASLPALFQTLPRAWQAWRLWGFSPSLSALLPHYSHWLDSHPTPGGGELGAWTGDYFIPYFAQLQRWLTGPLAEGLNGWLSWGGSPGPLPPLRELAEAFGPGQRLGELLVELARSLCGDHPELSPLLGLWLALALWLPLRLLLAALLRLLDRFPLPGEDVRPSAAPSFFSGNSPLPRPSPPPPRRFPFPPSLLRR